MTTLTAADVWRKYVTDGVPGSGTHDPEKRDIIAWGTFLESIGSGGGPGLGYATYLSAAADLDHDANTLAIVYNDSTASANGLYEKAGASGAGSWVRIGDLPGTIVPLTVTGGTANAITATAPETPTVPGRKLYLMTPTANNSGATTIAVNGAAAVAIKNAFNGTLAANSLVLNSPVLMIWSVDHYQILIAANVDASSILADAQTAATSATASASAAAASASALGNQVHQYDTRALAAAATIPVGVLAIKVTRYATGHPLSYATYIPGTNTGPMAFAEAGGHYWELDLTGGVINPHWYGAIGDDSTDNQTALAAVITKAGAGVYAIEFQPGTYRFSGTLNFGASNLRTTFKGQVTLKHTGTGVAISLDGGISNSPQTLSFGGSFGWGNPPLITGNINTTKLLYRAYHDHSKCAARLGNASTTGYGFHSQGSVLSDLEIEISTNTFTFTSKPLFPIYLEDATDDRMHLVCEGMPNNIYGTNVENCTISGASEGNTAGGGIVLAADSNYNKLENFFCEANVAAAGYDFQILGTGNKMLNCSGNSVGVLRNFSIGGTRNRIEGGLFAVGKVETGAVRTRLDGLYVSTTFTDSGTNTRGVDVLTSSGYIQIP